MASVHTTVLIALALAAPLAAQTTPEDPPPAIIEGSVINIQNSRTIPRATVTLLHLKGTGSKSQRADGSGGGRRGVLAQELARVGLVHQALAQRRDERN